MKHEIKFFKKNLCTYLPAGRHGVLTHVCTFFLLLTSACGTLFGSGSAGEAAGVASDLVAGVDTVSFDVSASSTVYHAVTFTNFTANSLTVTTLAFYNNVCNDFSIYNVTDTATGDTLVTSGGDPVFDLAAGQQANINVRYHQTAGCPYTASGYETTLYIYYTQNGEENIVSATLEPTGTSSSGAFACDDITDNSDLYTETELAAPADGTYYLRIDRMRGYMFVSTLTIDLSPSALRLGTDVNGLDPADFIKPFIQVDIAGEAITVHQIIDRDVFCLPSSEDNEIFGGAYTLLTTDADYIGSVTSTGSVLVPDVGATILAEHIPDGLSPDVSNSDGTFQISLTTDLSTGKIPSGTPDSIAITDGLRKTFSQVDDNDDQLLPVHKGSGDTYYLQGTSLSAGTLSLVGVGKFVNTNNTFISDENDSTKNFLIDNEAYIFILLDATVMKAVAEGT